MSCKEARQQQILSLVTELESDTNEDLQYNSCNDMETAVKCEGDYNPPRYQCLPKRAGTFGDLYPLCQSLTCNY